MMDSNLQAMLGALVFLALATFVGVIGFGVLIMSALDKIMEAVS